MVPRPASAAAGRLAASLLSLLLLPEALLCGCARRADPSSVRLSSVPHLLEKGWQEAAEGNEPILAAGSRAVIDFFLARAAPAHVGIRLAPRGEESGVVTL